MKTFDGCILNQGFAENANGAYKDYLGHPGIDSACGYGSEIVSPVSGEVCAVYSDEKPAADGYVAVYVLVRTKLETFEFNVGHCSKTLVTLGQKVIRDLTVIGKEGNRGLVFAGNVQITVAMQKAGDIRGSHRHNQKRPVIEVAKRSSKKLYLQNAKGYVRTQAGGYYEYVLPYEQYAACVDFTKCLFTETLELGSRSYQVLLLQRALAMPAELATGYFGSLTQDALKKFQRENGIEPVGIVGPNTRALLNSRYGQLYDPVPAAPDPVPAPTPEAVLEDIQEVVSMVGHVDATHRASFLDVLASIASSLKSIFK